MRSFRLYWPIYDREATVAIVRINLLGGAPTETLNAMKGRIEHAGIDWQTTLAGAVLEDFDPEAFERITPAWRWELAYQAVMALVHGWDISLLPIADWTLTQLRGQREDMPLNLCIPLALRLFLQGKREDALALLNGIRGGGIDALHAFAQAQEGR